MPGQTLSEIRRLLDAAGLKPQHRFGQNFLIDLNLMRKLLAAGSPQPGDTILEVGAGTGSLTELLLESGARVVAVEIDRGLSGMLRERLGEHPRLTLVQADALSGKNQVNPLVLRLLGERPPGAGGAYKLIANLPYQIATPLLMDLLLVTVAGMKTGAGAGGASGAREDSRTSGRKSTLATGGRASRRAAARQEPRPPAGEPTTPQTVFERLTCTIQREVGERLGAQPRTEGYGPVSVITQTLADIQPLAILPPTAFWPRPQVESLMVTLRPRPRERIEVDDIPGFVALVQTAFQQRRKMLRRLLREGDDLAGLRRDRGAPRRLQALRDADDLPALRRDEGVPRQRPALRDADDLAALQAFARAGVSPEARPEELSPADWRAWFRSVQAARSP